ncbi:hypothetical protein ROZALSC1DRAFT_25131 [Rozella allomycis CSF55]|uniref:Uncharacterized protein n=1 Tax=Rozella allomycis (strain CSF55) TaxID=988480 RepID=A0A4P9YBE1_ROZAC|nr:hypothetical protein ROZALSC1DRAFT_25131 [Rozella allomycis CSF55]
MIKGGHKKLVSLLQTLLEAYFQLLRSSRELFCTALFRKELLQFRVWPIPLEKCFQNNGVYDFRTHSLKSVLESISATSGGELLDHVLPFRLLSQNINEIPLIPIQENEFVIKTTKLNGIKNAITDQVAFKSENYSVIHLEKDEAAKEDNKEVLSILKQHKANIIDKIQEILQESRKRETKSISGIGMSDWRKISTALKRLKIITPGVVIHPTR